MSREDGRTNESIGSTSGADPTAGTATGVDGRDGEPPESGPARMLAALDVPRNARWGFVFGVGVTLAVFVFFVVVPGAVIQSPLWYVVLAFVLAVGLGGLATVALTAASAYRLSREL